MSLTDLKSTFNTYKETVESFIKSNDERLAALEKKGAGKADLDEKVNRMNAEISSLEDKLGSLNAALRRPATDGSKSSYSTAHQKAFQTYIRSGLETDLVEEGQKALSVGSEPDGGYLAPAEVSSQMIKTLEDHSPFRKLATVITIGSDALDMMVDRESFGAGWVAEAAQRDETDTAKFAKIRIPTHEQYAEPRITQKLLDDANIDIEAWMLDKIAAKMASDESQAFVKGDGQGRPKGFLSYPTGKNWGVIQAHSTGKDAAFDEDFAESVLLDTVYSLKAVYLNEASWVMSRSTLAMIRKMRTENGQPLWQPSLMLGQPSTLLGYPVHALEDMPVVAKDSLSIAFGNFKQAYTIVDRQGLRILRDPFTSKPYVKFYTTKRVGGDVTNFEALKLIKFSA